MAVPPASEMDELVLNSRPQQTVLQQAEAVITAQPSSTGPSGRETLLQDADLIADDSTQDGVPAPAYGDTFGEIRAEKDGLATSASVTDDGRVNIRINQLNRRLSQILSSASRQQLQGVQDDGPPPPPYIPPSLGGDGDSGTPPPPSLNVVIQVVGSRGDVQPFIAIGKVLRDAYGHRVRLATHPTFRQFVEDNGLEFFSIGGDPSRLMAFMVKNPGLMPGFRSIVGGEIGERRKDVAEYIQGCWRSCYQAGNGMDLDEDSVESPITERPFVADCIIANPPSFAHIHCAEKLGVPLHIMFTMPYSPTQAFPHPLANIQSSNADAQMTNFMSYAMIEVLSWQSLGDIINRFRAKCLALEPVSLTWAPGMLQRLRIPHTYCWSPTLIPKPKDWGSHISISRFHFLKSAHYTPFWGLKAFLDAGPPPIYIGFGSIVLDDPNALTDLIYRAAELTGQRMLLSKGWGGIGAGHVPRSVFMLDNVPHDWLFERVSCVVHHGGAGTTAAGIAAGRPTVIVPFFGDQPFWGAMVARAGAGPDPIPHKQLTVSKLVDAINFCLRPETSQRAQSLASKIAAEGGNDKSAQSFHQFLEPDRLRCVLASSRAAAWRVRRTQIRLSPFAACTLANANLLDFKDLKLFRPQEYETDEGPWDPVTGGFVAACGAVSGMAGGLFEIPTETFKAAQLPFKYSWQRSQASTTTIANKDEASTLGDASALRASPSQSQTSLNDRKSSLSSIGSGILRRESSSKPNSNGPSRTYSSNKIKDRDMLRHRGAHGSKGIGRMVTSLIHGPVDISMSFAKGFHNMPKLWGDDTVRPQPRITDFKSGAQAAGKQFGFGFYDGLTGIVTQPWNGARKEGASGFVKGVGKGLGGFFAKTSEGAVGILGYTMKGVHKEVQKMFGSNVQNYIVASRASQGYEEWLQSTDAEKQDVIERWQLVQKYLKQKRKPDEMVRDFVDARQKTSIEGRAAPQESGRAKSGVPSTSAAAPGSDSGYAVLATSSSRPSQDSLAVPDFYDGMRRSLSVEMAREADQDTIVAASRPSADREIESLRLAVAASQAESQRHAREALEYEEQLNQAMEQSLREERTGSSSSEFRSELGLNDEEDEAFDRAMEFERASAGTGEDMAAMPGPSSVLQRKPLPDPGHLAGTTQAEFEAEQQRLPGEKTAQERMEEDIVMEYVKKQSLLEQQHRNKGKERATGI